MVFTIMEKYWKQLIAVPVILLILAAAFLAYNIVAKGSFMERDVELKGGKIIEAEVRSVEDVKALYPKARTISGQRPRVLIEITDEESEQQVIDSLRDVMVGEPTVRRFGPALSEIFWKQAQFALFAAFVAMSVFVFILYRSPVPSFIVILAAATDIVVTIAVLDVIGVKLSLAVLAALVMIIGYSVDTDILLTSNMLRKGGGIDVKIRDSMKTGLTMSAAAIAALAMMYMIPGSPVLSQMALVLMIGVIVDIPATWFANAGLLKWWLIRKSNGEHA